MANITTKYDINIPGTERVVVWKSLNMSTGDVLTTGLLEVWDVEIQSSGSLLSWTVGTGANRGKVTFILSAPVTNNKVVVRGR